MSKTNFDCPTTGYALLPSVFAKTTLFLPLLRGNRPVHNNQSLPVHNDPEKTLRCSGPQLDEGDRDTLMGLILLSGKRAFGENFSFTRYLLFQVIKQTDTLTVGKTDYEALDASLKRLSECKVALDVNEARPSALRSLLSLEFGDDGHITCRFNACLDDIFSDCIAINLAERRSLRSAFARALHILLHTTTANNEVYKLYWLSNRYGQGSTLGKVRERVEKACEALQKGDVIVSYEFYSERSQTILRLKRRWKPDVLAVPKHPRSFLKEKPMFVQGTLVFSKPLTCAYFPNTSSTLSVPINSEDKRDAAILVRGKVFAPIIPDNAKIIVNPFIQPVDHDLVLVRRSNTFAMGFASFSEDGRLTLKFPGHRDQRFEAGELDQIVRVRGIFS